jgi:hypothetical protein
MNGRQRAIVRLAFEWLADNLGDVGGGAGDAPVA